VSRHALAIIVPVLDRPHRVEPLLASITAATPEPHRVLFVADEDDDAELAALKAAKADVLTVGAGVSYAAKINAGYHATTEPVFFMAADDLAFRADWYSRAASYFSDGIHVVGTNDLCNPRVMCGQHSTHTLVKRSYIEGRSGVVDEPNAVLHEGYAHDWVDDEFVQTAMARGVYAHAFDSLVEHLHPLVEKADDDDTYRRGRAHSQQGRRLFRQRRRLWLTST
jgi:glycosyltransferase involved in cell wall biosynthesis